MHELFSRTQIIVFIKSTSSRWLEHVERTDENMLIRFDVQRESRWKKDQSNAEEDIGEGRD